MRLHPLGSFFSYLSAIELYSLFYSIDISSNVIVFLQELENHHLDTGRNMLKTMQLKPQVRQQLTLLLQRQNIEEQELRLRHWMEMEKFYKGLGKSDLFYFEQFLLTGCILNKCLTLI